VVEKWCWCRTFPGDGELRLPVVYRNSIIEGEIMNKKIRKKLRRLSQFFCGVGVLCGYAAMFLSAAGRNIGVYFLIGMVVCVYLGILLSDYFLDSFK